MSTKSLSPILIKNKIKARVIVLRVNIATAIHIKFKNINELKRIKYTQNIQIEIVTNTIFWVKRASIVSMEHGTTIKTRKFY